jgi:hypothetical protein
MTLAIAFVAIAGPSILALVLYWRNNPDRRRSWRRAAEDAATTPRSTSGVQVCSGCSSGVGATAATAAGATAAAAVPASSQLDRCEERAARRCMPALRSVVPCR